MPSFSARYGRLVIPVVLIILILHLRSTEFRPSPSPVGVEYVDQHTDPNPEPEVKVEEEHVESIPATDNKPSTILNETNNEDEPPIICPPLPGIEDVLVVVKTGITEAQDKIPVHLRTTLRCIPHRIIVSDYEEDISGVRTYDVLENVNETLKQSNDDFRIYNRAREYGRAGLLTQDLATEANGPTGMPNNPGWKLDKWKFLPMVCEAARARPDARWYVFLEADTYAIWRNLLAWLDRLDSNTRLYLGNQMQIGPDLIFAHGGSGFVLSQAAVQALLPYYSETRAQWDDFTETQWAGDSVLGKVLAEAGVPLTWSWPLLSTRSVWEVDSIREAFGKRPWCVPAVTFHHMTPADVERMHEFEQEWFAHVRVHTYLFLSFFLVCHILVSH